MRRQLKRKAPPLDIVKPQTLNVYLRTITPMFGGSATSSEVDEQNPVRAASVRGHLRFWWRATAGAHHTDKDSLFKAESEIWGSTEKAGQVRVEVRNQKTSKPYLPNLPKVMSYVTFPFEEKRVLIAKAIDVEFSLIIHYPEEFKSQLEEAVNAWVLFGGIGARTRRGCGSLERLDSDSKPPQAVTKGHKLLTVLPVTYWRGKATDNPLNAWVQAVSTYANFRQGDGIARVSSASRPSVNGRKATPGRSYWPEPDSLRRATGRASRGHEPKRPEVDGYPRTDLGLPIGFQFKDEGDPEKLTLQGAIEKHERFASPVITKVMALKGQYYPVIIVLDSPHVYDSPYGVSLVQTSNKRKIIPEIPKEKLQLTQSHSPQNDKPIREALISFIKDGGFSEFKL